MTWGKMRCRLPPPCTPLPCTPPPSLPAPPAPAKNPPVSTEFPPAPPSPLPPGVSAQDAAHLRQALALAEQGFGLTEPNPRVGCVITAPDGRVIGQGHTQQAGGAHAEVMAMRDATAHGESLVGSVAYVTLEPCAHHGRTPPCCDALIRAGIGRVYSLLQDPFPLVAGQGLARLRAAGVEVITLDGTALQQQATDINVGFVSRITRGTPWVRLKTAVSLDGRTALADGSSQWITGAAARADGHSFRKRASAVLTGVGTVLADDPRLDVRLVPTPAQPLRVVLDSSLRTPAAARILDEPGRVLLVAAAGAAPAAAADALRARGAELLLQAPAADGRVDLPSLLQALAARGVNELHVEAGERLSGAFLQAGLVDELLVYQAPVLVGPGRGLAALPPLARLADAARWRYTSVTPVGADLRLLARRDG
jgi:diaminohydroxyphosphoribosylaminopyrimidine deaminase / 5-amino-6-(5-phosphoribosylamino)uracil reductase